eukprot:6196418-Pleurochrysis_carterae.AAC.4
MVGLHCSHPDRRGCTTRRLARATCSSCCKARSPQRCKHRACVMHLFFRDASGALHQHKGIRLTFLVHTYLRLNSYVIKEIVDAVREASRELGSPACSTSIAWPSWQNLLEGVQFCHCTAERLRNTRGVHARLAPCHAVCAQRLRAPKSEQSEATLQANDSPVTDTSHWTVASAAAALLSDRLHTAVAILR